MIIISVLDPNLPTGYVGLEALIQRRKVALVCGDRSKTQSILVVCGDISKTQRILVVCRDRSKIQSIVWMI